MCVRSLKRVAELKITCYNESREITRDFYFLKGDLMGKIDCMCGKMLFREENGVYYFWCKNCKKEVPFVFVDENGKRVKTVPKRIRETKSNTIIEP